MATRRGRRVGTPRGLIPVRANSTSSSLSCWYCDWKIFIFNELLFYFGQRYSRFVRIWMNFGVAFSLIFLIGITMILFWEAAAAFHLHCSNFGLKSMLSTFWGTSPLVSGFSISVVDFAVMISSTLISVTIHELGHVIAAASEGVPIEYIAIFLAGIFPGALVAFNSDLLQASSKISSLRTYCAGIWHNALFCAVCGLAFFLMPFILHPLFIHDENAMVLGTSQSSPLSDYLSRGDVILLVDGENIRSPHQLIEKVAHIDTELIRETYGNSKGYCVPNNWIEESKASIVLDGNVSCPDYHMTFIGALCLNSKHNDSHIKKSKCCLSPQQVVKLNKCGEGWGGTGSLINHCECSEEESCMAPLLSSGISWLEISYSSMYSSACLQQRRNTSSLDPPPDHPSYPCGVGTFVYVGDRLTFTNSIRLSAYQPRSMHHTWIMDAPAMVENMLTCAYRVSATLAALNSLPVFYLDGEYILEIAICFIAWLSPRKRRMAANIYLTAGTILSAITVLRIIYFTYYSPT